MSSQYAMSQAAGDPPPVGPPVLGPGSILRLPLVYVQDVKVVPQATTKEEDGLFGIDGLTWLFISGSTVPKLGGKIQVQLTSTAFRRVDGQVILTDKDGKFTTAIAVAERHSGIIYFQALKDGKPVGPKDFFYVLSF